MTTQSVAIAVLIISLLVMILLRFPIAYAVALSSIFCLMAQGLPPELVQKANDEMARVNAAYDLIRKTRKGL